MDAPSPSALHDAVLDWYDDHARELPWRGLSATPWSVMVSEFMLQQTPVARVLPVHAAWLERWPTPAALAGEPTGEAVRTWGRLGYPRRALRLHAAATADRRAPRRRGAGVVRRPARAARHRRLHRRGDRHASPSAGGTSCSTPTCAGSSRARSPGVELPAAGGHPRRARRWRPSLLPDDPRHRRHVGGGDDGARRAGVHRAASPRATPARSRPLRLARRRLPGVRRAAPPRPGLGRHRPAVPRPAPGACCATRRAAGRAAPARGRLARGRAA